MLLFDFQRLTIHGLRRLFIINKFKIVEENPTGSPLTTATLLGNIALVKTTLNYKKTSSIFNDIYTSSTNTIIEYYWTYCRNIWPTR